MEADCIALRDAAGREDGAAARARIGESLTDELFAEVALLHVLLEPEFADRAHTAAAGDNADRTDDIAAVHHVEMPRFARSAVVDAALEAFRVVDPRLLAHGGNVVAEVGGVVAEDDIERAIFVLELCNGGVFRVAGLVDFVQRHALKRADDDAHGHAVGKDGDRAVRVRLGDVCERLAHPLAHLGKAFTAGDVPVLRVVAEIRELFRVDALKLRPRGILPIAHVDLAQRADGAQRQTVRFIDGKRRDHRAETVA